MAVIKNREVREQNDAQLSDKLMTYVRELNTERGTVKNGGRSSNPGKISELKRTIARIKTILHERKLGAARGAAKKQATQVQKPAETKAARKQ